ALSSLPIKDENSVGIFERQNIFLFFAIIILCLSDACAWRQRIISHQGLRGGKYLFKKHIYLSFWY
uniref:Uncharacterized protein n=1 Tax=Anas platyrhynchos TaxID=8839 RepID=A0A8B9SI32_ANAPL